jgi:proline dehydrogenase
MSLVGRQARRALIPRAARGYCAGPALEDALAIADRLARSHVAATLGYWDGPTAPADAGPRVAGRSVARLTQAATPPPGGACVALKVPGLSSASEPELDALAAHARAAGCRLVVDAPSPDRADAALAFARRLGAGIALPGRWGRALDDAETAIAHGLPVRVVKGEWPDPDDPLRDPRAGFLEVVDRLAGRAVHVGVATHDHDLAEEALRRLQEAGTPCELELLVGLPVRRPAAVAQRRGVLVRVYVGWGDRGLPYEPASLRNPRLVLRLLGDAVMADRRRRRTEALSASTTGVA